MRTSGGSTRTDSSTVRGSFVYGRSLSFPSTTVSQMVIVPFQAGRA